MKRKLISKSIEIDGKPLVLEVGRFAEQASACVMATYGETVVLAAVTASEKESSLDYFPLSVSYMEKLYAGGRIKGSRWVKREGRPTDDAILAGRVIDRSIRPLFPKSYKHDVQVILTVLSVDGENDPDVVGLVATSAAIAISHIPWNGPIGGVRVGNVEGAGPGDDPFIINPTITAQSNSDFDLIIASTKEKVVMIEGGFCETPEDTVLAAIAKAKEENAKIIECIESLVAEVGKKKVEVVKNEASEELKKILEKDFGDQIYDLFDQVMGKESSKGAIGELAETIAEALENQYAIKDIAGMIDSLFKLKVRKDILENNKRIDGRAIDEVRPLEIEVGVLPRTHGSAVFGRGATQALTITTLGTPSLEQLIESPMGEESKRYIHHYTMPPYSVGETGRVGYPSRREIGHGALAEKALLAVIPPENEFPYTIRLVSEIMSSNGSTSMASTCGSTLSLMDAGVPIKEPVAGISVGLMTGDDDSYVLLTDIVGYEDFSGDMDFKVAGTKNGITAIQLDIKVDGLSDTIVTETLTRARDARMLILDQMQAVIAEPRKKISTYAPKVQVVTVPVDKIGEVIGPGGRMIRQIIAATGANVDVEDDGSVMISGTEEDGVNKAVEWVQGLTREVHAGEEFDGEVKRLLNFGAFVEILPGKEGLVHVSKMSADFVKDPGDVVKIGDAVRVRVSEIDDQGRINLTMRLDESDEAQKSDQRPQRSGGRDRRRSNDRRRGRRGDR